MFVKIILHFAKTLRLLKYEYEILKDGSYSRHSIFPQNYDPRVVFHYFTLQ